MAKERNPPKRSGDPSLGRMVDLLGPFYPRSAVTFKDWKVLHFMVDVVKTEGKIWDVYRFFMSREKMARFLYPETSLANATHYLGVSLRHLAAVGMIERTGEAHRDKTAEFYIWVPLRYLERREVIALILDSSDELSASGLAIAAECRESVANDLAAGVVPVALPNRLKDLVPQGRPEEVPRIKSTDDMEYVEWKHDV